MKNINEPFQKEQHVSDLSNHLINDECRIQNLLQEAKEIACKNNESGIESAKLLKLLEEIIIIKSHTNDFKPFFDSYEKSHRALMQLDYSQKPLLSDASQGVSNLFDYISSALALSIEKIESSTVSRKGINTLFSILPVMQDIVVIITDTEGKIRFINENGECLFNVKNSEIIYQSVKGLFENHHLINEKIQRTGTIHNMTVNLVISGGKRLPAKLDLVHIKELDEHEDEIPETLYVLNTDISKDTSGSDADESAKECFSAVKKMIRHIIDCLRKIFSCLHIRFHSKKLSDEKKQFFYKDLHALLSSGTEIIAALEMIYKKADKKADRKMLSTLKKGISEGLNLSAAMKQSGFFTPYEYLYIKIGEESGKLLVIVKDLSIYFENKKTDPVK